jgi:phosphoribosylanthranilate isomerase
MPLAIKICGMKDPANIQLVAELSPDFMGFIFYQKSPRFAGDLDPKWIQNLPSTICKTGVFVNETEDTIRSIVERYQLNAIQLHGNESPADCSLLQQQGLKVIKALSIATAEDFRVTERYYESCDYLLFDTKTPLYGGSGLQYDWSLLDHYTGILPFFLSGGISPDDAERIRSFSHPKLYAIDLNSRFESESGVKNEETLKQFINELKD